MSSSRPILFLAVVTPLLILGASTAEAVTVTIDGGLVDVTAQDHGQNPVTALDRIGDANWTSSFGHTITNGRATATDQLTFQQGPNGFRIEVTQHDGTLTQAPLQLPGQVNDEAVSSSQIVFTVTQPTTYSFTGSFNGQGTNDAFKLAAELRDLPNNVLAYQETGSVQAASNFAYSLGTNPFIGTNAGVIGPGQYRFIWDMRVLDNRTSGGEPASTSGTILIVLGDPTPIPEPATLGLLAVGAGAVLLRRRRG